MIVSTLVKSFYKCAIDVQIARPSNGLCRYISTATTPLGFKATPLLCAEPLKKKRKMDPAILRAREERRKKKIEKQIRRLQKNARQCKPIDELEVPLVLTNPTELKLRTRTAKTVSEDVREERALLTKKWAQFRCHQAIDDIKAVDRLMQAQSRALQELRLESEQLFQEAIQIDPGFLPFKAIGPVITPPIPDYDSPDGEYIDISKKWLN